MLGKDGSMGCMITGGEEKNKQKEPEMGLAGHVFDACTERKKQEIGMDGQGGQIGSFEDTIGKKRDACQCHTSISTTQKAKYVQQGKKPSKPTNLNYSKPNK